jgi:hypothetical protein
MSDRALELVPTPPVGEAAAVAEAIARAKIELAPGHGGYVDAWRLAGLSEGSERFVAAVRSEGYDDAPSRRKTRGATRA